MKSFALFSAALVLGFTLVTGDAEAARRLGGGKSSGMQREAVSPQKSVTPGPAAPSQAAAPASSHSPAAAAAAPQAQPKRSWMGPLAGLAAGIGLAALASHFGFGEELASMLMIGLLVMVALAVVGFILRRRAAGQQAGGGMQYAAAGAGLGSHRSPEPMAPLQPAYPAASAAPSPVAAAFTPVAGGTTGSIPVGFDTEGFLRVAKVNFLRLQAANDAGNIEDIREFTTPEMFAEIRMNWNERGTGTQETDVVSLEAQLLDVSEENGRHVASVRFQGQVREAANAPAEAFDEVWHLVKPADGRGGWVLAGIQQVG